MAAGVAVCLLALATWGTGPPLQREVDSVSNCHSNSHSSCSLGHPAYLQGHRLGVEVPVGPRAGGSLEVNLPGSPASADRTDR